MTKKPPKNKQNEAYWQAREQAEKDYMINNLKSDDAFNQILQARYNHTANELSDKITAELSRLSDKNGLSYAEAQKAVRSADMKRLGNEAKLIVQKARATGNKELTKEVADRLRLYNATMRINSLEMLKGKIGQEMTDLGIDLTQDLQKRLASDYQNEVKRQAGLMSNSVASANSVATTAVLKHVYGQTGGANFSNRVWHNMDVLKSRLDMEMSNVIMTGKNIQDVAKELRPLVNKHVNNVRYATERIARTESARIQNEAKLDALKRNGYKFCKWHAEPKACPECAQIARQDNGWGAGVYKVSDVPYLRAHPCCRCSLSAYWVDDETLDADKKYLNAEPAVVSEHSLPMKYEK
ncbi:MAG: minor capsid protein [Limosilactobacillus sp.]|nr:minor capsid protein [Limosilactobacillus sp.]